MISIYCFANQTIHVHLCADPQQGDSSTEVADQLHGGPTGTGHGATSFELWLITTRLTTVLPAPYFTRPGCVSWRWPSLGVGLEGDQATASDRARATYRDPSRSRRICGAGLTFGRPMMRRVVISYSLTRVWLRAQCLKPMRPPWGLRWRIIVDPLLLMVRVCKAVA